MKVASAVIIGNEILSGKFEDENGPYLIKRLRTLGTRLNRLVTIPDTLEGIAAEVRLCADRSDYVFTTGGVGPTHDDMTFEGVAMAFEEPLVERQELVELIEFYKLPVNEGTLRMARVPASTELINAPGLAYPVAKVRNVYVFPGVPKLFRSKFEAISERFRGEKIYSERLYASESETNLAVRLALIDQSHPEVEIGSYPRFGESQFKVIITLEGANLDKVNAAKLEIIAAIQIVSV